MKDKRGKSNILKITDDQKLPILETEINTKDFYTENNKIFIINTFPSEDFFKTEEFEH